LASPNRINFDDGGFTRLIRRIIIAIVAIVGFFVVTSATVTRIDAGHVGVRVKLAGSARGVQDIPVVTGWVFFNPLTEQIIEFPISVQNVVWTASANEGRTGDESITFSSGEGVNINCDIGLSFHIDPILAPHLYLRFRQPNLALLADGYVRNAVREAFNVVASKMAVQDIYGAGKSKVVADVGERLREALGKDGFVIDQITINGALRLPENVAQAINRAMEATQNSIQAENRVRQVRAEADQAIAEAHGGAEAARQRAGGEADAVLIRARADAKANEIIRYSTTGAVLQYRAIAKWDGKLPMMNGAGQIPMLTFDVSKIGNDSDRDKRLRELLDETAPAGKEDAKKKESTTVEAPTAKPPETAPPKPPEPSAPAP
jgi:regulator of protease activity HflC (stomatin/prohibitin superfamily)